MGIRSFLAFELPDDMKKVVLLVSGQMQEARLEVRVLRAQSIHLTLVFLGDVRREELDAIRQEVSRTCSDFGPFHVSIKAAGVFPNPRRPNVMWAGIEGDLERMALFRDALEACLLPFGVKQEKRAFRPHLTLGRFRKGARGDAGLVRFLTEHETLVSPVCRLDELILFKSDLKPSGAVYTRLQAWPLMGTR
jgi:2'-5' RNA ligase